MLSRRNDDLVGSQLPPVDGLRECLATASYAAVSGPSCLYKSSMHRQHLCEHAEDLDSFFDTCPDSVPNEHAWFKAAREIMRNAAVRQCAAAGWWAGAPRITLVQNNLQVVNVAHAAEPAPTSARAAEPDARSFERLQRGLGVLPHSAGVEALICSAFPHPQDTHLRVFQRRQRGLDYMPPSAGVDSRL